MNVNFEVTDTTRVILSVHQGCGNGSMIVFTPDGKGQIVNDTKCIEQVKQIMASTPGFDIVYDSGAYVNDERRNFESDSGISFLVIRKEYWERALNQVARGLWEKYADMIRKDFRSSELQMQSTVVYHANKTIMDKLEQHCGELPDDQFQQVRVDGAHLAQPDLRRGTLVQVASIDLSRCTHNRCSLGVSQLTFR